MKVWIYKDRSKREGDPNQLVVFASLQTAEEWLREFDPEGVALEYPVFGKDAADQSKSAVML